jgi:aromatic-L-amino-acid decarboxylase
VAAIAEVAARHRLWLHVDAALAGSAMILPEMRRLWEGVEAADSLVLNPHKWLGAGIDFSAYYVRDPAQLVRAMSIQPSYLRTAVDGQVTNFRDWGVPLGRRFRALKLWFLLRDEGVEGLQARLRRDLDHAAWLAAEVDASPGWERLAPVPLQTVCLRHRIEGAGEEALAAHNLAIAARVNREGRAYVTPAMLGGKQAIRVSIGAMATERADVEAVWAELRAAAG